MDFPDDYQDSLLGLIAHDPEAFHPYARYFDEKQFRGGWRRLAIRAVKQLYEAEEFPSKKDLAGAVKGVLQTSDPDVDRALEALSTPVTPHKAQETRKLFLEWMKDSLLGALMEHQAPTEVETSISIEWPRLRARALETGNKEDARLADESEKHLKQQEKKRTDKALEIYGTLESLNAGGLDTEEAIWEVADRDAAPSDGAVLYPCWVPAWNDEGVRMKSGQQWVNLGNTGDGKSIVQTLMNKMTIEAGVPVCQVGFENDLEDDWIDMAVCICQEATPVDLDVAGAKQIVGAFCREKCGRRDAFAVVSFQDLLADHDDIMRKVRKIEKRQQIFYPVISVDALGDLTSEKLEAKLKSEYAASKRMLLKLKRWVVKSKRVLYGTVQTNRSGESDKSKGRDGGIDGQAGSLAFAKKSTTYCLVDRPKGAALRGLKVLKSRKVGRLTGTTIPMEYVEMRVGDNQRGFVRIKKTRQVQEPRWLVLMEEFKSALVLQLPLTASVDGKSFSLDVEYGGSAPRVQASNLQAFVIQIGQALAEKNKDLYRGGLMSSLMERKIITHKTDETIAGGHSKRTFYHLCGGTHV